MLPRRDAWLSCHLPRHGQEWGRHGPLGCFTSTCSRLGSRVLVSCPHGFQLTCQDGVQLCHHVLCVVQAEAHRWLKFQDVPPRTISAQQNVILLQPVGQDTAGPAAPPPRALQGSPQPGLGLRASALATLPLDPHRPVHTRTWHWLPPAKLRSILRGPASVAPVCPAPGPEQGLRFTHPWSRLSHAQTSHRAPMETAIVVPVFSLFCTV